ncbi:MAG: sulfurtransferase complex subunit TusC [Bermanella sp.]
MTNKILIIQRTAPYGSSLAREGLDYVLTSAVYDQDISLLFLGDGVFQLLKNQDSLGVNLKPQGSALEILPLYDISKIYAVKEDLQERSLLEADLILSVKTLSRNDISQFIKQQEKVVSF